jgi:parvulin-like peptidyl-prolyl isomerase
VTSKRVVTIVLASVLLCATAAAQEPTEAQARVLAVVNGQKITDTQVWWTMEQGWGGQILDDMITDLLVRQAGAEAGLKVSDIEVDEELARTKAEYPTQEAFDRMLREAGMTLKGFRMRIHRSLLVEKLLAKRAAIDEHSLRQYYEAHRADFTSTQKVHLFDIVTLTLEEAYAAREQLAAGEPFSTVAAEVSHDPTAREGGDRGWVTPDDVLVDKVREVVFSMQLGEISNPVQMEDHCHIFYAKEVQAGQTVSFEEAKPEITRLLREQKGVSEELYLSLLKQRAKIEIRWAPHAYLRQVYADLSRIKVVVDDERVALPRPAELLPSSNLMVPAVAVLRAIGAGIEWDEHTDVLTATRGEARIRLIPGFDILAAGERELKMKEAPVVRQGVLMISPRAPLEALGCTVLWNRSDSTLYVDTHTEESTEAPADMPSPIVEP